MDFKSDAIRSQFHDRCAYFGKKVRNLYDVLNILNGKNLNSLYWYLEKCMKHRNLILNEFNISPLMCKKTCFISEL